MAHPLVTVLTPVYNGGPYLAECIESVLKQTATNFEYVIVDNVSTDDSLAIAREYERKDPRIRVVACEEHLSNHIENWNRALGYVSPDADYIKVVHADDWIFEDCIARMVDVAERHPCVGMVGAYRIDEDRVTLDGLPPTTEVVPGRELARSFLLGGPLPFVFGAPTSLLLRASIVRSHDPFYNPDVLHADTDVCMLVLAESDFGFVHQVLTYTRRHNEAVTAFVRRVGTYVPADVDVFQRWGRVFLTPDEYDRKLVVRLVHYAGFLASDPAKWARGEFWRYHRERLHLILGRTSGRQVARGASLQARRTVTAILSSRRDTPSSA